MEQPEPFTHGVASGDPLTEAVILWTRLAGPAAAAPVRWRVALDPELVHVVAEGTTTARVDGDGTVHVDATGLSGGTTYWYGFEVAGVRSPVGRTRTLPDGDVERVRFAMASCAKFNAGFFNAYDRIADRAERGDLDLLLHLGDYIYEASNTPPKTQTPGADIGRPFSPLHECATLADYRTRYAQYCADPSVQRVRAALPLVATLDDHELADGAWRDGADAHDEATSGPWADRRAAAFRAREEWLPIRRPDPDDATRVFRAVRLGELGDLLLTDARSRRDRPEGGAAVDDPARSALGPEQRDWLLGELSASTATWRLWANPSVLSSTFRPDLPDELVAPMRKLKLIHADELACDHDQWDGYAAERTAILDHVLEAGVRDLVVLSGDIHVGAVAQVTHRDVPVAVELVTASLTSQNLDDKLGYAYGGSHAMQQRFLEAFPAFSWVDVDGHGYVEIDLDEDLLRASWWFVDTVLEPSDHEFCAAVHEVRRGRSGARRIDGPASAMGRAPRQPV